MGKLIGQIALEIVRRLDPALREGVPGDRSGIVTGDADWWESVGNHVCMCDNGLCARREGKAVAFGKLLPARHVEIIEALGEHGFRYDADLHLAAFRPVMDGVEGTGQEAGVGGEHLGCLPHLEIEPVSFDEAPKLFESANAQLVLPELSALRVDERPRKEDTSGKAARLIDANHLETGLADTICECPAVFRSNILPPHTRVPSWSLMRAILGQLFECRFDERIVDDENIARYRMRLVSHLRLHALARGAAPFVEANEQDDDPGHLAALLIAGEDDRKDDQNREPCDAEGKGELLGHAASRRTRGSSALSVAADGFQSG